MDTSAVQRRRLPSRGRIFVIGIAAGAVAYAIAKVLVPKDVESFSALDLALARNIGFVFPALIGLSAGWIQGSLARMLGGTIVGSATGGIYAWLCGESYIGGYDYYSVVLMMIGFPCFCGGMLAAFTVSDYSAWAMGMPFRLLKGLLAGLACGLVYIATGSIIVQFIIAPFVPQDLSQYSQLIWKAGLPAFALAGGCFLVLICWAIGLRQQPAEAVAKSPRATL